MSPCSTSSCGCAGATGDGARWNAPSAAVQQWSPGYAHEARAAGDQNAGESLRHPTRRSTPALAVWAFVAGQQYRTLAGVHQLRLRTFWASCSPSHSRSDGGPIRPAPEAARLPSLVPAGFHSQADRLRGTVALARVIAVGGHRPLNCPPLTAASCRQPARAAGAFRCRGPTASTCGSTRVPSNGLHYGIKPGKRAWRPTQRG